MASKKDNKQKTLIDFFDQSDIKFLNIPKEKKERIKNLPMQKEAKKWPKAVI